MPATNIAKSEVGGDSTPTTISSTSEQVVVGTTSEIDNAITKLTAQDLEDLEKIQAELDSLTSNYPESSTSELVAMATANVAFTNTPVTIATDAEIQIEPALETISVSMSEETVETSVAMETVEEMVVANEEIAMEIEAPVAMEIKTEVKTEIKTEPLVTVASAVTLATAPSVTVAIERVTVATTPAVTIATVSQSKPPIVTKVTGPKSNPTFVVKMAVNSNPAVAKTMSSAGLTFATSNSNSPMTLVNVGGAKGGKQVLLLQKPVAGATGGQNRIMIQQGGQRPQMTLNNLSFLQAMGGKQIQTSTGQILNKVKLVSAAGAAPSTVGNTQQQTIMLASPNKTFTLARSNTQMIRTTTAATATQQAKPGMVFLSPVKGKPGQFSNITLKSPTRIAPAPNTTTTPKVTIVSAAGTSSNAATTTAQKIILRPIVPGTKPTVAPTSGAIIKQEGGVQQIQVPGSKFNYVRLVSAPNQATGGKQTLIPVSSMRGLTPTTTTLSGGTRLLPASNQMRIAVSGSQSISLNAGKTAPQRILIPGGGNVKIEGGANQFAHHFPPGSILSTTSTPGGPSFVMVSAQYMAQLQQQQANGGPRMVLQTTTGGGGGTNFVPIAAATTATLAPKKFEMATPQVNNAQIKQQPNGFENKIAAAPVVETTESRPRKPCNCTKSQCLKLYCDCFANGEFCHNCNCSGCANNLEKEEERQKAIKSCLDRNPQAFHPKIGKSRKHKEGDPERRHTKGCNCKRSGCLKNYCECYEAKILCTNLCKCNSCKNFEESSERKTLMHLADAAEVRVQQQAAAKSKLSTHMPEMPFKPSIISLSGERLPFSFITPEVTEATLECMLARAENGETTNASQAAVEKEILEEFGRCIVQIIDCANKTRV